MNFRDAIGYNSYTIYNWLGTHRAPEIILDLFIPLLCEGSIKDNFIYWVFLRWMLKKHVIMNEIKSIQLSEDKTDE